MKTKAKQKISFPLRLYLQQLFCPDIYVKFINPFSFWRKYRINHLQTCWEFNTVQYLERCHQLEYQPPGTAKGLSSRVLQNNYISKSFNQIKHYESAFWQKKSQNRIFMSQPSFELKYRGVTYFISPIVEINANKFQSKSNQVNTHKSDKKSINSNNSNISSRENNITQSQSN